MVKPVGMKIVNTTFGDGTVETLVTFHVMLSVCPTFGVGLWGVPVIPTAVERLVVAGNGTVVCWLALTLASAVPASSVPLATTVLRMAWLWICTITVMVVEPPAFTTP
jgi:hypothetical protein